MGQIRTGHFQADGDAYNLELGFIPNYLKLINANAGTGEVAVIEWFGQDQGDDKAFQCTIIADNGTTSGVNFNTVASGGYASEFDTQSINTSNPVQVTGEYGVTIAATWMDDDDEIWYVAIQSDRDEDLGDVA